MDYIKEFSNYCDIIIRSKQIEIPDKNKPHALRKLEFKNNVQAMKQQLDKLFTEEMENLQQQASEKGNIIPTDDKKVMASIAQEKFDSFIAKAEARF